MGASGPKRGGSDGDGNGDQDWRDRAAQVLPTEHFTLQSARAATVTDSSSRAGLYLSSVSLGLVALGIVGQASDLGTVFSVFGLVLFPTLFFLGFTTFVRVTQSAIEDMLYGRGINRIRHFYQEFVPEATPYFILSAHDDTAGELANMGIRPSWWQIYVTTGGTIGVVNSVVGGTAVGLAADLLGLPLWLALVAGAGAFVVSVIAHSRLSQRMYGGREERLAVQFPTPAGDGIAPPSPPGGVR